MACLTTAEDIVKFTSLLLIATFAFIGNTLVIMAGMRSVELRKFSNVFLFIMALADLLQSTIIMPFSLASVAYGHWPLASTQCSILAVFKVIITLTSVQSLAGISLDRYFYIVKNRYVVNSKGRTFALTFLVFSTSIGLAIAPLFGWGQLGFDKGKEVCTIIFHQAVSHTLVVFGVGLCIPVAIMAFCYYNIFATLRAQGVKIKRSQKIAVTMGTEEQSTDDAKKREVKILSHESYSIQSGEVNHSKAQKEETPFALIRSCSHQRESNMIDSEQNRVGLPLQSQCEEMIESIEIRKSDHFPKGARKFSLKRKGSQRIAKFSTKELQLLRTIILVIVVFLSCWFTYVVFNLLRAFDVVPENKSIDTVNMWLGFANSALNPIIYGMTNRQIRKAVKATAPNWCTTKSCHG